MAISVVMPALEMAQETGKLVSWLKKEGEQVKKGEMLLEVETDKAVVEIEAQSDGVLGGVTAKIGDVIPVGQTIAWLLKPGEQPPSNVAATQTGRKMDSAPAAAAAAPAPAAPEPVSAAGAKISPKARRLALPTKRLHLKIDIHPPNRCRVHLPVWTRDQFTKTDAFGLKLDLDLLTFLSRSRESGVSLLRKRCAHFNAERLNKPHAEQRRGVTSICCRRPSTISH